MPLYAKAKFVKRLAASLRFEHEYYKNYSMVVKKPCNEPRNTLPDEAEANLEKLACALKEGWLKDRVMEEVRNILIELYRPS